MFVNAPFMLSITHAVSNGLVGIQADIKTATVLGGFGLGVATAVSAQIDGQWHIQPMKPDFVRLQLRGVLHDFSIAVAKSGRLISSSIIHAVADELEGHSFPLVVDPVCVSHKGPLLLDEKGVEALRQRMVPLADVLTPNRHEAALLSGLALRDSKDIAPVGQALLGMGAKAVLITGWEGRKKDDIHSPDEITDWLIMPGRDPLPMPQGRVHTRNLVGCGNTLAMAIAAWMTEYDQLPKVVSKAQAYLNLCLHSSHMLNQGDLVPDLAAPLRARMGFPQGRDSSPAERAGIIGHSPALAKALQAASGLAPSMVPVLILGETGTGKGLFAEYIHAISGRGPFVSLNCAAIPETLLESTLFGHKRGAFTGAVADLKGQFDLADGGTLFLDEIAELPIMSQVKLLRVLESGMVQVLGEAAPHKVDVRIVAATNRNLKELMARQAFREDLYYRLNVGTVLLPPLREREQDIPALAQHCLDTVNQSLPTPRFFTAAALAALRRYDWPGNIRELANIVECSARLSPHRMLDAENLHLPASSTAQVDFLRSGLRLEAHIAAIRDNCIVQAVERCRGNCSEAARLLGLTPQAVSRHMRLRAKSVRTNESAPAHRASFE